MDLPRFSVKTDDNILDENTAKRAETHTVRGESVYSLALLHICTISSRFCTLSGFWKMAVRTERKDMWILEAATADAGTSTLLVPNTPGRKAR